MEVSYQNQDNIPNTDIPAVGGTNSLRQAPQEEREAREAESDELHTPQKAQRSEEGDTTESPLSDREFSPGCPAGDDGSPGTPASQTTQPSNSNSASSGKSQKTRYKGKGLDANGRPRNFYNPPGKVLRSLANQSYYDNFYGNQGQIYTLKQKYKT